MKGLGGFRAHQSIRRCSASAGAERKIKTMKPFLHLRTFGKLPTAAGRLVPLRPLPRAAEPGSIPPPTKKAANITAILLPKFCAPLILLLCALWMPWKASAIGSWTSLTHSAPGGVGLMLLMPDGTVLAASRVTDPTENPPTSGSRLWYRLTPDIHGSYINGTWTTNASMRDTRLWCSSAVMPDGRVFVAGAEYGTGSATAEIFDPVHNQWTQLSVPASVLDPTQQSPSLLNGKQQFADCACVILTNKNILLAPVGPATVGGTVIDRKSTRLNSSHLVISYAV